MLQKSGRLVLWEAMFILELHSAETQDISFSLYPDLKILGFLPPVLLSEKPTEISANSPEASILEICLLTVACLTLNNTSICFGVK